MTAHRSLVANQSARYIGHKPKPYNNELVTDEKRLNKLSAKPTYVSSKIFNENLVGVHTKKERLLLDKPSYVRMCILDLSKTHMYDFHYNYIKKKIP